MAFDPDAFLAGGASTATATAFDPDAFLGIPASNPTAVSATNPQGFTPEQKAIADQFIAQAQKSPLDKLVGGGVGLAEALWNIPVSIAKGIGEIPSAIHDPNKILDTGVPNQIIPSFSEGGRRVGMTAINLGSMLSQIAGLGGNPFDPNFKPPEPSFLNALTAGVPIIPIAKNLLQGIGNLSSHTPTQEEIAQAVANAPFQQAVGQERTTVSQMNEGANPVFSEGIAQALEAASPAKGAKVISGAIKESLLPTLAKQSVPRLVRMLIKPEAKIAAKIEAGVERQMPEIFHANPNADTLATTPMEGFTTQVKSSLENKGTVLNDLRAQSGTVLNAGDRIAAKIESEAAAVSKTGNKDLADEMLRLAEQRRGSMTEINSLQKGVTMAGRKYTAIPKTTAQGMVDEIIAREGGDILNEEMKTLGGAAGEVARKDWSDLKTISDNLEKRANKLINDAPVEAQPALIQALNSAQGVAGVFALAHGWTAAGATTLVGKIVSDWAKKAAKDLKDPNKIVTHIYERLRAEPPPKPVPITITPQVNPLLQVPEGTFIQSQNEAINRQMAQMTGATPTPRPPANLTGPLLSPSTSGARAPFLEVPTSSLPPTAADFNAYLQRILAEQEAAKARAAAGSTMGFF